MSGKYLHGLIVDGTLVDVRDNVFSHSELRELWTGRERKHKDIKEWSWDFVTREFVETPQDLIPTAQTWINNNLNNHEQLIAWVNRNWEGLVNGDEPEREIKTWELIDHQKAKDKNKLVNTFLKACTDWGRADANLGNAYNDWKNAYDADLKKADADWGKACADRKKADANLKKAYKDWEKADADWKKAGKKWKTRTMKPVFSELLKKYPNKYWAHIPI